MSPAEELSYIKDLKTMILADARALYSAHGLTSRTSTFEVITSKHGGAYQATLIVYSDLSANTCWSTLYDGLKCTNMGAAMKMLWDGIQTNIGELKAMQYQALVSPVSPNTTNIMSPTEMPPMSPTTATFSGKATMATEATMVTEPPRRSHHVVNGSSNTPLSPVEEKVECS